MLCVRTDVVHTDLLLPNKEEWPINESLITHL